MSVDSGTKVTVQQVLIQPIKHTIKAARLLYTPPSYILRGPIYLIFVIAFGALLYSFWGRVDVLVTAPMKLQRESTTIQAVGGGLVTDVVAVPGSSVRFNDLLVSVQEQMRMAGETEKTVLQQRIFHLEQEIAKTADEYDNQLRQFELELADLTTNRESRRIALEGRIQQIEQQLSTAQRTRAREAERLTTARSQFERTRQLYESRDITVTEFEAQQDRLRDVEKSIGDIDTQIAGIRVELATAKDELNKLMDLRTKEQLELRITQTQERRARDIKTLEDEIASIRRKLEEGERLVEGVTFQDNVTIYRSNFEALVTDVHVARGQIIGSGTPLVTMVRETAPLEAQALVENKDIGNLRIGQEVKLKYFAYPYQEYGIQEGVITDIATKPGGVEGFESMYPIRIALKQETISKRGERPKQLEIGLEGFAEVKTGEKRLIEIVFSPVSRFFASSEENYY